MGAQVAGEEGGDSNCKAEKWDENDNGSDEDCACANSTLTTKQSSWETGCNRGTSKTLPLPVPDGLADALENHYSPS